MKKKEVDTPIANRSLQSLLAIAMAAFFALPVRGHSQEEDTGAQNMLEETVVTATDPAPRLEPVYTPVVSSPTPVTVEPEPPVDAPPLIIDDQIDSFRTGTRLLDIPQSVSVFTEERITDQNFTSLGEIVDYTPGLTNTQGEGHRDAVLFRGRRATADFYVDGLRDDVQYFRSLYNVEQVEVLRGPTALYFGRGNGGGLINRVLKKPILGTPGSGKSGFVDNSFVGYEFTVNSFGGTMTQFDINESSGDRVGFRLNTYLEDLNNHREFFKGTRYGFNPTMSVMITPDTRLDVSYEYENHDRFIDRGIPAGADLRPATQFVDTVFGDPTRNYNDFEAHVFRSHLNHKFNDSWRGRVSTLYGTYDKVYANFYPASYDPATDIVGIDGYIDNLRRERFGLVADLVGEFNTGWIDHKLLIGTEYNNSNTDANRFLPNWTSGGIPGNANRENFVATGFRINDATAVNANGVTSTGEFTSFADNTSVEINAYSFFLQDEISFGDHVDLVLGARYDSIDVNVVGSNRSGDLTGSRSDQEISPRMGLVLKPVEDLSFYGLYSESFLPQSGEQFANLGNSQFDPNIFATYEVGAKYDIKPGLNVTAAWFTADQTTFEQVGDDDNIGREVNSTVTGWELAMNGNITDRWSVYSGYTYLDGGDTGGIRLGELPEHQFSLWNTYELTEELGVGLGVIYQDDSFTQTVANSTVLPSYVRFDAAVFYKLNENTRLQLNIENLFDEQYFPHAHSRNQMTVGRPVNAAFSIRGTF